MGKVARIFVGGGGDDWISGIVKSYAQEYGTANPAFDVRYFSWTETGAVRDALKELPSDANVAVVGHSYGGDSAFAAIDQRMVDLLVSIDPVGRFKTSWTAIRARARVWLNVRAEPDDGHRTRDDTIAWIGGQYGRPPRDGGPNHSYIANETHSAFRAMMRSAPAGQPSAKALLGGNSVN